MLCRARSFDMALRLRSERLRAAFPASPVPPMPPKGPGLSEACLAAAARHHERKRRTT